MRFERLTVLLLIFFLSAIAAQAASILQVYPQYIEKKAFQRIRSYFTGEEYVGRRIITRTEPDFYEGYYFVLRLVEEVRELPPGSQVQLAIIVPEKAKPLVYRLPIPDRQDSNTCEIYVGITGDDWNLNEASILAWKVALISPEQRVLSKQESFLWSMPEKQTVQASPVSVSGN